MIIRIILIVLALVVVMGILAFAIRAANAKHVEGGEGERENDVTPYGPVSDDLNPDSWKTPEYGSRE